MGANISREISGFPVQFSPNISREIFGAWANISSGIFGMGANISREIFGT
jgi:hypothetical protein